MNFTISQNEKIAVWALACVTFGFIAYWFISQSPFLEKIFQKKYKPREKAIYWVVFQRIVGAIFLGILPMIAMSFGAKFFPNQYGDVLPTNNSTWCWIAGLSALILPINYLNAKKPDNLAMYPQIRTKEWTTATFIWEYSTWIAYLYAYELLFRGILLFAIFQATQMAWLAISVNVAIYAIAHIPKGQKEAIGAIPLGVILSYLTLAEGNIWIAVVVHIVLAISNSFFSFLAQPEYKWVKK